MCASKVGICLLVTALFAMRTTSAQETHQDVIAQVRSLSEKPFLPFTPEERSEVDSRLRARDVPPPGGTSGCYLVYGGKDELITRLKLLTKAGDRKIGGKDDAQAWIEGLKVGEDHQLVLLHPEQSYVGKRPSTKWRSSTTKFHVESVTGSLPERLTHTKDPVDGVERTAGVGPDEPLQLYVQKKDDRLSLIMRATYRAKDWIFAESVSVSIGDRSFAFKRSDGLLSDRKVFDRGVCETLWFELSERPDVLFAVLNEADKVDTGVIRFRGDAEYVDKSLIDVLPSMRSVVAHYYLTRFEIK